MPPSNRSRVSHPWKTVAVLQGPFRAERGADPHWEGCLGGQPEWGWRPAGPTKDPVVLGRSLPCRPLAVQADDLRYRRHGPFLQAGHLLLAVRPDALRV